MDNRIKYDLNNSVIKHGLIMMAKGVGGISRSKHTLHYYQHHGYPDMVYSSVYFLFKRALKYNPKLVQLNKKYHHDRKVKVQNRRKQRAIEKQREAQKAHSNAIAKHKFIAHKISQLTKQNSYLKKKVSKLKSLLYCINKISNI